MKKMNQTIYQCENCNTKHLTEDVFSTCGVCNEEMCITCEQGNWKDWRHHGINTPLHFKCFRHSIDWTKFKKRIRMNYDPNYVHERGL